MRNPRSRFNISTFRFDFYGHGESEGRFEMITPTEAVDDILQAIRFLKGLGYTKIGLFGSIFGGGAAMTAASQGRDLFLLILKAPVSNYLEFKGYDDESFVRDWKKRGYRYIKEETGMKKLNYSFYEDVKRLMRMISRKTSVCRH